jgi:hypothetical protein
MLCWRGRSSRVAASGGHRSRWRAAPARASVIRTPLFLAVGHCWRDPILGSIADRGAAPSQTGCAGLPGGGPGWWLPYAAAGNADTTAVVTAHRRNTSPATWACRAPIAVSFELSVTCSYKTQAVHTFAGPC